MKILAVLDEAAFNGMPDATVLGKDAYIKDEKTNTFKLGLDSSEAEKLATGLQTKFDNKKLELDRVHGEKNDVAAKLKVFEDLGKTPEEIEQILKDGKTPAVEELERAHKAQLESIKTEHGRALAAIQTEADAAKTEKAETEKHLIETIKSNEIAKLTNDFGVTKGGEDFFANRISVVYDEELKKYAPRVMENGEVAYKGTAFKTPAQLAEEVRADKDYANLFTAGNTAGSGAPAKSGGGPSNAQLDGLSAVEKLKAARQ